MLEIGNVTVTDKGFVIIPLDGHLDGGPDCNKVSKLVKEQLEKKNPKGVIFDLKDIRYINNLGNAALIIWYAIIKKNDVRSGLMNIHETSQTILKTWGLLPLVYEVFEPDEIT